MLMLTMMSRRMPMLFSHCDINSSFILYWSKTLQPHSVLPNWSHDAIYCCSGGSLRTRGWTRVSAFCSALFPYKSDIDHDDSSVFSSYFGSWWLISLLGFSIVESLNVSVRRPVITSECKGISYTSLRNGDRFEMPEPSFYIYTIFERAADRD